MPGLPYEETFKYVRPVLLDRVPVPDDLVELLQTSDADTLTNPWSLPVLRGFMHYIPTTFRRITQNMPPVQQAMYFDITETYIPEPERVLLQLQTEIEAKAATIDAAIIGGRREQGTVVNKAHVLNRLYNIGRLYGHLQKRDYPFLFGDLTKPETWDNALSDMKIQFMEYMLEVPVGGRQYPVQVRHPDVSQAEVNDKYPYVEWLKNKLGDDLIGVLLYGSAARTDNPDEYSDFDNWVRVRDVRKAHEILRGTNPACLDCRVIEGEVEGSKHVGIHIFPESDEYLLRHIRFLHDSWEFFAHTKVLYGDFPFTMVAQDEVIERGLSQAYIKLKTIAGSLNWAYSAPEKIVGKPNLFEFIVKNVRFFLQHSLNAQEGLRFRDKHELIELLTDRGLHIPDYKPDLTHIKDSLIYAMVSVLQLQQELVDSGYKPNLEFLIDQDLSPRKSVEDWSPYDDD